MQVKSNSVAKDIIGSREVEKEPFECSIFRYRITKNTQMWLNKSSPKNSFKNMVVYGLSSRLLLHAKHDCRADFGNKGWVSESSESSSIICL